jgi:hypothetical protein
MLFDYTTEKKPLQEYIKIIGDKLVIPPSQWLAMLDHYSKQEIKPQLAEAIKGLPFPVREYTEQEVKSDWTKLKAEEISYAKESWLAPRQSKETPLLYRGEPVVFTCGNHGLKVSNQHSQIMRMKCGYHSGKAPVFEWENCDKKNSFLRCLFGILKSELASKGIDQSTLYRALKMHTYMASQFKPSCAKTIYDFFGAKRVLDTSAGWGDRLVGFHASNAISYIGIDPNSELHQPYEEISNFCNTGKETKFICSPAEDADLTGVEVDFVFTSPPYFDIERYSEEETQSWKRYPTTDKWLEGFLFPMLSKSWGCLVEGGRIAINIADKKGEDICTPMLKHMESLGATYEGVVGYKLNKRNGIGLIGTFCEPIWIWSKGEAPEPKFKIENFFGV